MKHRLLNGMVGVILLLVAAIVVMVGYDFTAMSRATDLTAEVKGELNSYQAATKERQIASAEKLDALQHQIDRRFEANSKQLEKISDKLDAIKR